MTAGFNLEFVGKIWSEKFISMVERSKQNQVERLPTGCLVRRSKVFIHFDAERVTINKPKTMITMPIKSVGLNSLPRTR